MLMPNSTKSERKKASEEMMQQELGTITTGLPLTHKKKVTPMAKDHGNITAWEQASEHDQAVALRKDQIHHDFMNWRG